MNNDIDVVNNKQHQIYKSHCRLFRLVFQFSPLFNPHISFHPCQDLTFGFDNPDLNLELVNEHHHQSQPCLSSVAASLLLPQLLWLHPRTRPASSPDAALLLRTSTAHPHITRTPHPHPALSDIHLSYTAAPVTHPSMLQPSH